MFVCFALPHVSPAVASLHRAGGTTLASYATSGHQCACACIRECHSTEILRCRAAFSQIVKPPPFRALTASTVSPSRARVKFSSRPASLVPQRSASLFCPNLGSRVEKQTRRTGRFRCKSSGKDGADDDEDIVFDEDGDDEDVDEEDEEGDEEDLDGALDSGTLVAGSEVADGRLPITYQRMSEGLNLQKADYTISSLVAKFHRGKLELQPSFQRDFVWDRKMASRLIESLLLGIPVPTIFMHEMERGMLEVVDGRQRLTSICGYVDGVFPDGKEFRLTGCENLMELNGLLYSELTEECQERIMDYALNVHTILKNSHPDLVFEVFERLNMGSVELKLQELRNCVYRGSYNKLLEKLSSDENLLQVLKLDRPHKRMFDRELILRFFAVWRGGPKGFCVPVKEWLNLEMQRHQNLSDKDQADMERAFCRSIALAWAYFGGDAFRSSTSAGKVNIGLWDTLMYGFAKYPVFQEGGVMGEMPPSVPARKRLKDALEKAKKSSFKGKLKSTRKDVVLRDEKWEKAVMDVAKTLHS